MNKKGFTLTELLATIIIISLLVLLASNAISVVVRNSKNELYDTQMELIISTAKVWGTNNIDMIPNSNQCAYLTLGDLKGFGLLEESIINPKTNEEFSDEMKIKVSSIATEYGVLNTTYEIVEDVTGCAEIYSKVCKAVTNTTASLDTAGELIGTIPSQREDYNIIKYKPGDEYICEVKENTFYHFYVLSTNNINNEVITTNTTDKEVTSVNLILDRNVYYNSDTDKGLENSNNISSIEWSSSKVNGPVTAMTYLHSATKDWNKISNIIINYEDEGFGYGKIETNEDTDITTITMTDGTITSTFENLKVRLPMNIEVTAENVGCGVGQSSSDLNQGSCPLWLVNYMKYFVKNIYPTAIEMVNNKGSFWLFSTNTSSVSQAFELDSFGYILYDVVDTKKGVRPVITLKTYNLY